MFYKIKIKLLNSEIVPTTLIYDTYEEAVKAGQDMLSQDCNIIIVGNSTGGILIPKTAIAYLDIGPE
jgi:hypothetical protein